MLTFAAIALAQDRPGLLFREDWKETPAATPATQEHVANADLILAIHGPGKAGVKKSHHDKPADDPYYIWSGTAQGNWAVSLKHRKHLADLTGQAKVRWRTKQAGFRELRVILQLANGTWLVSDASDPPSLDWREREFNMADLRWRLLDIDLVIEKGWADRPDLSKVEAIGFTDLMTGGESAACSRLDWIEVYAKPVPRSR
jgi:hypothetical protein